MPPFAMGVVLYLLIMNLVGALAAFIDKRRAKRGTWRIPEATLLWIGALGGAAGMYLTMRAIRHKTRHAKFMVGLPLILVVHTGLLVAGVYMVWLRPAGWDGFWR